MSKLKILVGCEFSGAVRRAFRALGHEAFSCDLLPADDDGEHLQGDVRHFLNLNWDLGIFFPPCTYLCGSGMHWTTRGLRDPQLTEDALNFVSDLLDAPIPHIAIENPVGAISTKIRKPNFSVQPYQFGDPFSKKTCFWTKNLPNLIPTNILETPESGRWSNQTPTGQNKLGPSKDRWKLRSATYPGLANAMAEQWGKFVEKSLDNI